MPTISVFQVLLFAVAATVLRAESQESKSAEVPDRIRPVLTVVPAEWCGKLPPTGTVNAPDFLSVLHPGQRVAFALLSEGANRDQLFEGTALRIQVSDSHGGACELELSTPTAVRRIKAEGADMALAILEAGQISAGDREKIEAVSSMVSLAVFSTSWSVPAVGGRESIKFAAALVGGPGQLEIEPATLSIRPVSDWLAEPLPSREKTNAGMNRYRAGLAPGEVLQMLIAAANSGDIGNPSLYGFFVIATQNDPLLRDALIASFGSIDRPAQQAVAIILQMAGFDAAELLPQLPSELRETLQQIRPLQDPRHLPRFVDPVDPAAVQGVGAIMDRCWAGWMATGDRSYLRALVELFNAAADYPALEEWTRTRGGLPGLNARVARGLAYQISGWSVGSFQRTDPLVSDWLIYWRNDPETPESLRTEIANLPTNPAFRRDKQ